MIDNNIDNINNINEIILNYLENYLNSGIKIIIPSFIDEYLWLNNNLIDESLIIDIKKLINTFLIKKRNNIRELIKKNNFEISGLISLINDFSKKIKYISNIFNNFNTILNNGIKDLNDILLSDNNLILLINNKIKLNYIENNNISNDLNKLYNIIYKLSNYYKIILNNFNNILSIIISNNINYAELPINKNLQIINNIHELFNYINYYYKFLYSIFNISDNIVHDNILIVLDLTLCKLLELLKNAFEINNFNEMKFIFTNYLSEINKYINFNENNENYYILLYNEIIIFVNKLKINNNNFSNDKYSGNCVDILLFLNKINKILYLSKYKNMLKNIINNNILTINMNLNIEYIDYIIINYINIDFKNCYDITLCINNIIENICSNFNLIDIINKYYDLLLKRLMYNFINKNHNIYYYDNEQHIIKLLLLLKNNLIKKYLYKIDKVLNDFNDSINDNTLFINNNLNYKDKLYILTISYNSWDINQNEGLIDYDILKNNNNSNLTNILLDYNNFYKNKNNNKNIYWFPHFGFIDITFNNKNIKLLPIQFMILELFDNNKENNYNDIINNPIFTNYSDKFKNDILSSLIISKLLLNNNKILNITKTDDFETDLINLFFTTSDYAIIWEERREKQFMSEKKDIIKTNINQLVKQSNLNKIELYNKLKDKIKLFDINIEQYEECLNYMLEFNYLCINNNIINKIYY
jgi:hypothetical protein